MFYFLLLLFFFYNFTYFWLNNWSYYKWFQYTSSIHQYTNLPFSNSYFLFINSFNKNTHTKSNKVKTCKLAHSTLFNKSIWCCYSICLNIGNSIKKRNVYIRFHCVFESYTFVFKFSSNKLI